jgi:hypothetical protein
MLQGKLDCAKPGSGGEIFEADALVTLKVHQPPDHCDQQFFSPRDSVCSRSQAMKPRGSL